MIKKIITITLFIFFVAFLVVAGFLGYAAITTYHPSDIEKIDISGKSSKDLNTTDTIKILSWNVGYCGLGESEDCYFDGGKNVIAKSKDEVNDNFTKIRNNIVGINPDVIFLQEVDIKSKRSYKIDEKEEFEEGLGKDLYKSTFAINYKAGMVPYPFPTMLGEVKAGIQTFSKYDISESTRIQLHIPFSWPMSMLNLKRCLLISRVKVNNKELVLINLHLEAYDDGEGRKAQLDMLKEYMDKEVEKGNYVIVGGDFNQTFSNSNYSKYPYYDGNWQQGVIETSEFSNFNLYMDNTYPTCRLLDKPYKDSDKSKFQYYMIDGFMVSKNINVLEVNTINYDFVNSDHNPVVMNVKLG